MRLTETGERRDEAAELVKNAHGNHAESAEKLRRVDGELLAQRHYSVQALVARDAKSDAGAGYGRAVVPRKKLLHFAHTLVAAVRGGPEKVKVVVQELLYVNPAALVPAPSLRLARVESRQQQRVRKTARYPAKRYNISLCIYFIMNNAEVDR